MAESFKERLRDAMLASGIETPEALAKLCDIKVTTAIRCTSLKQATLRADLAYKLARGLNVRVGWLISGELPVRFTPAMLEAAELLSTLPAEAAGKWLANGRSLARRNT